MLRFKLKLDGIDMCFNVLYFEKASHDNTDAWCDTEFYFYLNDKKLNEVLGEAIMCSELEDVYQNLKLLLCDELEKNTSVSCIEPYFDFYFYKDTDFDNKHLEIDVRFWNDGCPTENFLKLNLYEEECEQLLSFLNEVVHHRFLNRALVENAHSVNYSNEIEYDEDDFDEDDIEETVTYRYIKVVFNDYSSVEYSYLDENRIAAEDSYVWVPVGRYNEKRLAYVVSVGEYTIDKVPFPLDRTKKVLRVATDDEVAKAEGDW